MVMARIMVVDDDKYILLMTGWVTRRRSGCLADVAAMVTILGDGKDHFFSIGKQRVIKVRGCLW